MDREDYAKVIGEVEKLRKEVNVALNRLRQDLIDIAGIVKRNIDIDVKNLTKGD